MPVGLRHYRWDEGRGRPEGIVALVGALMRSRFPRHAYEWAQAAGVGRATVYRYFAEIERQAALPLRRVPDPANARCQLVGIDWERLR